MVCRSSDTFEMNEVSLVTPMDVELPYETSFETSSERDAWTIYTLGDDATIWSPTTAEANSGSYSFQHSWNYGTLEGWLVSPALSVSTGMNPTISFYQHTMYTFDYRYHGVWASNGSGDPTDGDFVELAEIDYFSDDGWNPSEPITMVGYSGTAYIAFKYEGADGDVWYVDDVIISVPVDHDAACEEVVAETPFLTPGSDYAPKALFKNTGLNTESFNAVCVIEHGGTEVLNETHPISSLPPGEEREVTFSTFLVNEGDAYVAKFYSDLSIDDHHSNDTIRFNYFGYTDHIVPIVQKFTAIDCYYCPRAAEGLHRVKEALGDSVIILAYHTTLAFGADPFYCADAVSADDYFGVTGYPNAWVNGVIDVGGGYSEASNYGFDMYMEAIREIMQLKTPFQLTCVTDSVIGDEVFFTVDITANGDIVGIDDLYLRFSVAEDEIEYYWNPGDIEQDYIYHAVRDMVIGSYDGIPISLNRGESFTNSYSFNLDSEWNREHITIVALLQSDVDMMVWQAYEANLEVTGINDAALSKPKNFQLQQNVPNPFNAVTRISFTKPGSNDGTLAIYDLQGREMRSFDLGNSDDAIYWNGRDNSGKEVPGGIYLYRLDTADFSQTRKMILLK
ncbi:choice-of-anchor J domain-containing protein [bacterium]|nr:choice-of-anchor J domain-containing protein [bacterium]